MRRPLGSRYLGGIAAGLVACGVLWMALFVLQLRMPTEQSRWSHELFEDKARIAQSVPGERLLVVGGSGALFGIVAERLSRDLGVAAVNVSVYAGLDVAYLLHQARAHARTGDVVLLALEYELLERDPSRVSKYLMDHLMARDLAYLRGLPVIEQATAAFRVEPSRLVAPWVERLRGPRARDPLGLYEASHLNAHGDTLANNPVLRKPGQAARVAALRPLRFTVSAGALQEIGRFVAWCRANGIGVVAAHPAMVGFPEYASARFEEPMLRVRAFFEGIGVPVVDEPRDAFFDRSQFIDARYHLDRPAAEARSARLAERLRPYVKGLGGSGGARPVEPRHLFAQIHAHFRGWRPRAGFGAAEGPYPQFSLPVVVWSLGARSVLEVPSVDGRPVTLRAQARPTAPGQELDILVNGAAAGTVLFAAVDFTPFTAELRLHAGTNRVEFVHRGTSPVLGDPRPLALLFRELVVD